MSIDLSGPVKLNLGDVSSEPVAAGWHTVTIERAEAKLSRQAQIPQIFVMSRVTDETDPDYNRTVIWNSNLDGGGLIFTKRFFAALGLPEELEYSSYQDLADDLIGLEVDVKVKHEEYEGETQARANQWRPASAGIMFD